MSSVYRGLRLALGIAIVVCAGFFAAPAAQAQWSQSDVCIWPTDVPEMFYGTYTGLPNCEALCKKTAAYCRKFVKDAASCWNANNSGIYAVFQKSECANTETPEDKSDCNAYAKEGKAYMKDQIKMGVESGIADCDGYQDSCLMSCMAL